MSIACRAPTDTCGDSSAAARRICPSAATVASRTGCCAASQSTPFPNASKSDCTPPTSGDGPTEVDVPGREPIDPRGVDAATDAGIGASAPRRRGEALIAAADCW